MCFNIVTMQIVKTFLQTCITISKKNQKVKSLVHGILYGILYGKLYTKFLVYHVLAIPSLPLPLPDLRSYS